MSLLKQKRKTSYQQNIAFALIQRKKRIIELESEQPIWTLTNSLPIGPSKKYVPRVPKNTFDIMRKRTKLLHFQDLSK